MTRRALPTTARPVRPDRPRAASRSVGWISVALLVAGWFCSWGAGCHSAPPPDSPFEAASTLPGDRLAVVTLRATSAPSPTRRSVQVYGTAHFARYIGLDRPHVLSLLGETDYADFSDFEQGQCTLRIRQRSAAYPEFEGDSDTELELHEAGNVRVDMPGSAPFVLRPQPFPELVSYLSGVSYEGVTRRRSWPERADREPAFAHVQVSGGFDVGPFEVDLEIAPPIRLVEVGGRVVYQGIVDSSLEGRDLSVSWEPTGGPSSLLVLELRRSGFDSAASLRCLVEDTGAFTLPADEIAKLPSLMGNATDRLSVHRITVQSFQTRDTDDGVALFVSEDTALLR